uniref:40S ribosomal protein S27 n=1 Tax=Fundulus heteroclitus TaxID=8078 RepID=A0A3Q2UP35_FUNHE
MPLAKDLLHPSAEEEKRSHKKKRLVQSPNSYFMDVKCPGCYKITTVFSHAQTVVLCVGCSTVLCQPTGGKARLTEGKETARRSVSGNSSSVWRFTFTHQLFNTRRNIIYTEQGVYFPFFCIRIYLTPPCLCLK